MKTLLGVFNLLEHHVELAAARCSACRFARCLALQGRQAYIRPRRVMLYFEISDHLMPDLRRDLVLERFGIFGFLGHRPWVSLFSPGKMKQWTKCCFELLTQRIRTFDGVGFRNEGGAVKTDCRGGG